MSTGTTIFHDGFIQTFGQGEQTSFLTFLGERDANKDWKKEKSKRIKFEALEKGSPRAMQLLEYYRNSGCEMIFTDTMENTRLLMIANDCSYPVRNCAIKSILDRGRIGGNALKEVSKTVFADILNKVYRVANGDALILYADGKVSALLSGDEKDYSILQTQSLFEETVLFLDEEYEDVEFVCGAYDHAGVTAVWKIVNNTTLLKVYQEMLVGLGRSTVGLSPALRLSTSDVGQKSVTLFPMLFWNGGTRSLMLGNPLRLQHRWGNGIDEYRANLKSIYAKYNQAIKGLSSLLAIHLNYPLNAMAGVMVKLKLPKKTIYSVLDLFKNKYGKGPTSAHDCYFGISEAIFMLQANGGSASSVATLEETIARAITYNWTDFDMPGDLDILKGR